MTYLTDNNGNFVTAELKNGKLRAKVSAGLFGIGATITLRGYDTQTNSYFDREYTIEGLGKEWEDKSYWIDEEDARSFGGRGEKMLARGCGRVQYAYLASV